MKNMDDHWISGDFLYNQASEEGLGIGIDRFGTDESKFSRDETLNLHFRSKTIFLYQPKGVVSAWYE